MKDLDLFFQQIPLALVYCQLSGKDTTSSQSQAFFPISKTCWKLTIFAQRWKSIQKATYEWRFLRETKGRWNFEYQNFEYSEGRLLPKGRRFFSAKWFYVKWLYRISLIIVWRCASWTIQNLNQFFMNLKISRYERSSLISITI